MIANPTSSHLQKRSMQETLKNTLQLLKSSFTLIGDKSGIEKPMVRLALLSVLMSTLFFVALGCFFSGKAILFGVLCMAFLLVVLVPLRFFVRTYLKAVMSRITYQASIGEPVVYAAAARHTRSRTSGLMFLSFVDMFVAHTTKQRDKQQGITGIVTSLVMSALAEVWDLLNNYMIPAVVIEEKSLKQCVSDIKALRANVPATLVGVFGIDLAGDMVKSLILIPALILLAGGIGIGYLIGPMFQGLSWEISGHLISWLPPLVALYLVIVVGGILKAGFESLKSIYFTIFYTTIMHPDRIPEAYREQLTGYLQTGAEQAGVNRER